MIEPEIQALDFEFRQPCEAWGGCIFKKHAEYVLRLPCCGDSTFLCERHFYATEAQLEDTGKRLQCKKCRGIVKADEVKFEKVDND